MSRLIVVLLAACALGLPGAAQVKTEKQQPALGPGHYRVAGIEFAGVDSELQKRVLERLKPRTGDIVTAEELRTIGRDVHAMDDRLRAVSAQRPGQQAPNERILLIGLATPHDPSDVPANPVRVESETQMRNLVLRITPVYPAEARSADVRGEVRMDVIVGADGLVKDIQVLSGDSRLANAAVEAVQQWVYRPALINGAPAAVVAQVRVNFAFAP
jgi:TonB family protein